MKNIKSNKSLMSKIMKGIIKLTKHKLFKNKIYAILFEVLGLISVPLGDGDITALIFLQIFAIPLFFAKENWIVD